MNHTYSYICALMYVCLWAEGEETIFASYRERKYIFLSVICQQSWEEWNNFVKNTMWIHGEAYVNEYKLGTIYSVFGIFKLGFFLINLGGFVFVSHPSLKTDCMWADFMFSFWTACNFQQSTERFFFLYLRRLEICSK